MVCVSGPCCHPRVSDLKGVVSWRAGASDWVERGERRVCETPHPGVGSGCLPGAPVHLLSTTKCPLVVPHASSSGQKLASRFLGVLFCPPFNAVAPFSCEETDGSAVFGVSAPAVVGGPSLLGTRTGRELPLWLHRAGVGGREAAHPHLMLRSSHQEKGSSGGVLCRRCSQARSPLCGIARGFSLGRFCSSASLLPVLWFLLVAGCGASVPLVSRRDKQPYSKQDLGEALGKEATENCSVAAPGT